jgi:hypothetical protein
MRSHFTHTDFSHRMNGNGTTDSICSHCFMTVATSTWEADLERAEAAHQCNQARLSFFSDTHKQPFRITWSPQNRQGRTA